MDDRSDPESSAIAALGEGYFSGIYEGDGEGLRRIFHPQCWLFGGARRQAPHRPRASGARLRVDHVHP